MKILILVDCYFPSTKSSAKQMHDLAVQFCRNGHNVTVCAPDADIESRLKVNLEEDVRVLRVRTGQIKGASKLVRAVNEIRLSSVIWRAARSFFRQNQFDLIIYYSPTIFFGTLVRRLKRLFNCPAYLILRDIFPQWAVDAGVLRDGLICRYFRHKEFEQYRQADVIAVQSSANLDYFRNAPVGTARFDVLYNWGTPPDTHIVNLNFRGRWNLTGKTVYFYGGNIGIAQDIDNIVRLAERMKNDERAFFLLVGEGSEVPRLRKLIIDKGLKNIEIKDPVSQQEYLCMVGEFDVGLICLDRKLKTHNFPGKLFGYFFHSIPILASINPHNDLQEILEKNNAGLVSINPDDVTFQNHARQLCDDPALRRAMGANGKRLLLEKFSVEGAAKQILSSLEVKSGVS